MRDRWQARYCNRRIQYIARLLRAAMRRKAYASAWYEGVISPTPPSTYIGR